MDEKEVAVEEAQEAQKEPPKKKAAPRKTVAVKVIAQKDKSVLVEYVTDGNVVRCYVPAGEVENSKASKDALAAGIPHGVAWEDCAPSLPKKMAEQVAANLRRRGIFTGYDVEHNPKAVSSALSEACRDAHKSLLLAAKEDRNANQNL